MKLSIALFVFGLLTTSQSFAVNVKGYFNKNGTYVMPHTRTVPNDTVYDNKSYYENNSPSPGMDTTNSNVDSNGNQKSIW